jgi:4-amino-4-deoxy-L-arabinose transferase-like glycosyltransferase
MAFLLVLFGIAFFQTLGRLPLLEPDEGRYAEIPREMLASGDFITPYLNYVKYFEKPPLHYWLNALSFRVFGQNEFAARFPGTLLGLLGILATYHLGRKLFDRRSALFAALILGTSVGYLVMSRINFTDMTLTFCMTACLGSFILAVRDDGPRKGSYYHLFYLFSALAVLAKGLIGIVLPGAIIFLYLLLSRRWRLLREMRLTTGIPLFLLVASPWFLLVSLRNPEFARFFFIHEHFERFLTKVHGRYQPFWFFVPVLVGCMLPWSLFLPAAAGDFWRQRRETGHDARLYLVLWAAVIFLFFSKSDSKLIPYILPVFPALALLAGQSFAQAVEGKGTLPRWQSYTVAACLALAGVGLLCYPHLTRRAEITGTDVLLPAFLLLGAAALTFAFTRTGKTVALFLSLCLSFYLLGLVTTTTVLARLTEPRNCKQLALLARGKAGPDDLIASFGDYEQGLAFYTGRRTVLIGGRGELEFGSHQGNNEAWFIEPARFRALWHSPVRIFMVIHKLDLELLRAFGVVPLHILDQQNEKFLITNQ